MWVYSGRMVTRNSLPLFDRLTTIALWIAGFVCLWLIGTIIAALQS